MAASRVGDVVAAAVTALENDAALEALLGAARVYTHVPAKTPPPYVQVLGGDEVPWGVTFEQFSDTTVGDGGDNGGRQVDVRVECVSAYRGSEQVDGIASQVMDTLTSDATWSGVTGFTLAEFVRNTAPPPFEPLGDGVVWFVRVVVVRVTLV